MQNALAVLETERIWDQLRARYYNDWLASNVDDLELWGRLRLKLHMIGELRAEMRKIANSGEMDNARDTGTE